LHKQKKCPIYGYNYINSENLVSNLIKTSLSFIISFFASLAFTIVVNAQGLPFSVNVPSQSGSFLAGQQAIKDLRTKKAASFFLDAAESDWENPQAVERAFIALVADGRVEDGAALAQHLIEMQPQNPVARLVLGTIALKERRYSSAITQFEKVRANNFNGISALILNAWALIGEKEFSASQDLLKKLEKAGLNEFLLFHKTLMADVAGERELALDYSKRAYEFDAFVPRIVEARVRILANALFFDEAQKIINDYNAQGHTSPMIDEIAKNIAAKKRPGKTVNNVQSGAADMFHGIGTALARDENIGLGYLFLRLGQYLDKDNVIITMALAQTLDSVELYEAANEIYANVPANSAFKIISSIRVAENLNALGDSERAISKLSNIATLAPDNLDAASSLGDILRFNKKYDEAIIAYSKALKIAGGDRPADWRFYYVRGISYERADKWPLAEKDFLKSLKLNPGHPQVLNYLGYSWVDKDMNLKQGLELIKLAVKASPMDGYIVDSLGWAYYRLGQFERAVIELEKAVNLLPNDAEINDHLGDAYWRVGRKLEANFQWKIAIYVDKDGIVTKRATPKLENGLD